MTTGTVLLIISFVLLIGLLCRNEYVYRGRKKIIANISKKAHEIAKTNNLLAIMEEGFSNQYKDGHFKKEDWRAYYIAFDAVSYNDMMLKFWRPVNSFYRGTILDSLLKERERETHTKAE